MLLGLIRLRLHGLFTFEFNVLSHLDMRALGSCDSITRDVSTRYVLNLIDSFGRILRDTNDVVPFADHLTIRYFR